MRRWPPGGLAVSVGLHALVVAALLAGARAPDEGALFIDLTGASGAPAGESGDGPSGRPVAPERRVGRGAGPAVRTPSSAPAQAPPASATGPQQPLPTPSPARTPLSSDTVTPTPAAVDPAPRPLATAEPRQGERLASGGVAGPAPTAAGPSAPGGGGGAAQEVAGGGSGRPGDGGQADAGALGGARPGTALARATPGEADGSRESEYAAYLAMLRRRIQESVRYPTTARRRGLVGTVVLEIEIEAGGTFGRVALVGSSSHPALDDAALEAVRGVERVPFPPGLRPRALRVRLPVVFELR